MFHLNCNVYSNSGQRRRLDTMGVFGQDSCFGEREICIEMYGEASVYHLGLKKVLNLDLE